VADFTFMTHFLHDGAMPERDDAETARAADRAGLCASCRWADVVTSSRGSTFYLCTRSANDPSFPRYPALPVLACRGYTPQP
jgi:hypothetical protein